ncbi:MAG: serine hydrolase [Balneolaceae bacterium]|nr:serine hydrolase [Balneolaceae bacterium]
MCRFLFHITTLLILSFISNSAYSQQTDWNIEEIFTIGSVESIVIQKDHMIIAEHYRGSMNRNRHVNIKSASKSVLSLLIGIAIERGYIESVEEPISTYFPKYFEQNPDPEKAAITIKDLLTMRSGLETTSFRNYGRWVLSNNWWQFALNQPLVEESGGEMIYSTGTSHLLSVILTRASGMSTQAFANRYLFNAMNIRIGGWDRDPQGYYMGGNNMAMTPADMLKTGRLLLDGGRFDGDRLISEDWIEESISVYTRSNFNPYDYGYMWWRKSVNQYDVIFAWGNGGQYIIILPELGTVLSITSNLNNSGSRQYQRQIFQFLGDVIIPFLENS